MTKEEVLERLGIEITGAELPEFDSTFILQSEGPRVSLTLTITPVVELGELNVSSPTVAQQLIQQIEAESTENLTPNDNL